jgi:hypothetical protein
MRTLIVAVLLAIVLGLGFVDVLSVEVPGISVYADRMVYARPAQVTVFGVVLDHDAKPVSSTTLSIAVTGPDGNIVFSANTTTGSEGRFSTSFNLSRDIPEGLYEVAVIDLEGAYPPVSIYFEVCDICVASTQPTPVATLTTTIIYTSEVVRTQTVYQTTTIGGIVATQTVTHTTSTYLTTRETAYITLSPPAGEKTDTTTVVKTQTITAPVTNTITVLTERTVALAAVDRPTRDTTALSLIVAFAITLAWSIISTYYAIAGRTGKKFQPSNF